MTEYSIRALLILMGILGMPLSHTSLMQAAQPDSLFGKEDHSYVTLGAGANLWREADKISDGTGTLSLTFPISRPLWVQLEFGVWFSRKPIVLGQIGVAARYDVRLTDRIGVYPKAGGGILIFVFPVTYVALGCGASYRWNQKLGMFAEVGNLLAYRESQFRPNWYFQGRYLRGGLEVRL